MTNCNAKPEGTHVPCPDNCGAQVRRRATGRIPRCVECRKRVANEYEARARKEGRRSGKPKTVKAAARPGLLFAPDVDGIWRRAVDAACSGVGLSDLTDRFGAGIARRAMDEARRRGALDPIPGYAGLQSLPAGLPA